MSIRLLRPFTARRPAAAADCPEPEAAIRLADTSRVAAGATVRDRATIGRRAVALGAVTVDD